MHVFVHPIKDDCRLVCCFVVAVVVGGDVGVAVQCMFACSRLRTPAAWFVWCCCGGDCCCLLMLLWLCPSLLAVAAVCCCCACMCAH